MNEYYVSLYRDKYVRSPLITFYGSNTPEKDIKEHEWFKIRGDEIEYANEKGRNKKPIETMYAIAMISLSSFEPNENQDLVISFKNLKKQLRFENLEGRLLGILESEDAQEICKYFHYNSYSHENKFFKRVKREEEFHYLHGILMQDHEEVDKNHDHFSGHRKGRAPISLFGISGDLLKIARIAIDRGIDVSEFKIKYGGVSDQDFEERINHFSESETLKKVI